MAVETLQEKPHIAATNLRSQHLDPYFWASSKTQTGFIVHNPHIKPHRGLALLPRLTKHPAGPSTSARRLSYSISSLWTHNCHLCHLPIPEFYLSLRAISFFADQIRFANYPFSILPTARAHPYLGIVSTSQILKAPETPIRDILDARDIHHSFTYPILSASTNAADPKHCPMSIS